MHLLNKITVCQSIWKYNLKVNATLSLCQHSGPGGGDTKSNRSDANRSSLSGARLLHTVEMLLRWSCSEEQGAELKDSRGKASRDDATSQRKKRFSISAASESLKPPKAKPSLLSNVWEALRLWMLWTKSSPYWKNKRIFFIKFGGGA